MTKRPMKNRQRHLLIEALEVDAFLGFHPEELRARQRVVLSLRARLDATARADALAPLLDYDEVTACMREVALARPYRLQESLLDALATILLERFSSIDRVILTCRKPEAYGDVASVGLELSCERDSTEPARK